MICLYYRHIRINKRQRKRLHEKNITNGFLLSFIAFSTPLFPAASVADTNVYNPLVTAIKTGKDLARLEHIARRCPGAINQAEKLAFFQRGTPLSWVVELAIKSQSSEEYTKYEDILRWILDTALEVGPRDNQIKGEVLVNFILHTNYTALELFLREYAYIHPEKNILAEIEKYYVFWGLKGTEQERQILQKLDVQRKANRLRCLQEDMGEAAKRPVFNEIGISEFLADFHHGPIRSSKNR